MQKQEITTYDRYNTPVFFQAQDGAAITASDSTVLSPGVLYIGTTGDVNVRTKIGTDLVFSNVGDASFLPVLVDMVYSTNTTASDILILR
jgi:hypothetical protein